MSTTRRAGVLTANRPRNSTASTRARIRLPTMVVLPAFHCAREDDPAACGCDGVDAVGDGGFWFGEDVVEKFERRRLN